MIISSSTGHNTSRVLDMPEIQVDCPNFGRLRLGNYESGQTTTSMLRQSAATLVGQIYSNNKIAKVSMVFLLAFISSDSPKLGFANFKT